MPLSMFSSKTPPPPSPRNRDRFSLPIVNTNGIEHKKKTKQELIAEKHKTKKKSDLEIYGRNLKDLDGAREVPLCG